LTKKDIKDKLDVGLNSSEVELLEVSEIKDLGEARYSGEKKGIPVRVEIGPKELSEKKAQLVFRNGKKELVAISKVKESIKTGLEKMQKDMLASTKKELEKRIKECKGYDEAKKADIAVIGWCGSDECGGWIKSKTEKDIIGMTLEPKKAKCIECKKDGEATYISKSY
jgi:prolyl-tRNA synthetase